MDPMSALDEWATQASRALGLPDLGVADRQLVLDVAREVAHNVVRPAAPLSTFLLGVAVGRGGDLVAIANALIEQARSMSPDLPESAERG
jgi:uncharacterized protein DUF6457